MVQLCRFIASFPIPYPKFWLYWNQVPDWLDQGDPKDSTDGWNLTMLGSISRNHEVNETMSGKSRLPRLFLLIGTLTLVGCGSTETFPTTGNKPSRATGLVNTTPPGKPKAKARTQKNPAEPVTNQRTGARSQS
jgi:hypothetical protein